MDAGIIGLPFVGKTALFSALTEQMVDAGGGGHKPNIGIAPIPDPRLADIATHIETEKIIFATMRIVDIPGLASGGVSSKLLEHIRDVDALIHVVRCFETGDVAHVAGSINPSRDMETVETELILSDLQTVESALPKTEKAARGAKDPEVPAKLEVLRKAQPVLEDGLPLRSIVFDDPREAKAARGFGFISTKRVLYVANVGDDDPDGQSPLAQQVRARAEQEGMEWVPVCAQLEKEIVELDPSERPEMLESLGLKEPALHALARTAYKLLGLQSFYTAGPKEVRAWTIRKGATAKEAAGSIHSDLARGFIRAEVYSFDDLMELKSEKAIKDAGRLRVEGKDYILQDEDVVHVLFNV